MTRTPLAPLSQAALGTALLVALSVPAAAQDVVIARPGTTTPVAQPGTTAKPGTTGIQITPGTIQIPPRPGTPGDGTTATTTPALMIPGPAGTLVMPGGTVIKRVDVPPLIIGTPLIDLRLPAPTLPNRSLRLIDPAALVQANVPPAAATASSTTAQNVVGPDVAIVAGRRGDALVQEPVTQVIDQPARADVVATAADAQVLRTVQPAFADSAASPDASPSAPAHLTPQATQRLDGRLTFSAKDGMHIYYVTPLDGRTTERSRVDGSVAPLSAYINERNARQVLMAAAECPAQAAPGAANAPAELNPAAADGRIDGAVFDRDSLCTHWKGLRGIKSPGPLPQPPPEPAPVPAAHESHADAVAYWQRTLELNRAALDKAVERLRRAQKRTEKARFDADQAEAEFERLVNLLVNWDPKKADWLIEGESNYIERLDAPDGKKQTGGRITKAKMASRRKTRVETERDLGTAKENRDRTRARVPFIEREERAALQDVEEGTRAVERSAGNLWRSQAGLPSGYPPPPHGPIMAADSAGQ